MVTSIYVYGIPPKGSAGIVTELDNSTSWIGGAFHTSDNYMIRPAFLISWDQADKDFVGVRADFLRLRPVDLFPDSFTYWGPGVAMNFYQTDTYDYETDAVTYSDHLSLTGSLLFGTQIMIYPGLGVFGDIKAIARFVVSLDSTNTSINTGTLAISLGAVLYFK